MITAPALTSHIENAFPMLLLVLVLMLLVGVVGVVGTGGIDREKALHVEIE